MSQEDRKRQKFDSDSASAAASDLDQKGDLKRKAADEAQEGEDVIIGGVLSMSITDYASWLKVIDQYPHVSVENYAPDAQERAQIKIKLNPKDKFFSAMQEKLKEHCQFLIAEGEFTGEFIVLKEHLPELDKWMRRSGPPLKEKIKKADEKYLENLAAAAFQVFGSEPPKINQSGNFTVGQIVQRLSDCIGKNNYESFRKAILELKGDKGFSNVQINICGYIKSLPLIQQFFMLGKIFKGDKSEHTATVMYRLLNKKFGFSKILSKSKHIEDLERRWDIFQRANAIVISSSQLEGAKYVEKLRSTGVLEVYEAFVWRSKLVKLQQKHDGLTQEDRNVVEDLIGAAEVNFRTKEKEALNKLYVDESREKLTAILRNAGDVKFLSKAVKVENVNFSLVEQKLGSKEKAEFFRVALMRRNYLNDEVAKAWLLLKDIESGEVTFDNPRDFLRPCNIEELEKQCLLAKQVFEQYRAVYEAAKVKGDQKGSGKNEQPPASDSGAEELPSVSGSQAAGAVVVRRESQQEQVGSSSGSAVGSSDLRAEEDKAEQKESQAGVGGGAEEPPSAPRDDKEGAEEDVARDMDLPKTALELAVEKFNSLADSLLPVVLSSQAKVEAAAGSAGRNVVPKAPGSVSSSFLPPPRQYEQQEQEVSLAARGVSRSSAAVSPGSAEEQSDNNRFVEIALD